MGYILLLLLLLLILVVPLLWAVVVLRVFGSSRLLVEEPQDLASRLFATGLFVRHDPVRCGQNDVTKLTTRQKVDNPLFNFTIFNIKSGTDHTTFVQSARQFNNNLVGSVVVDNFKFPNVSCEWREGWRVAKMADGATCNV